jgi:hypothetical protein
MVTMVARATVQTVVVDVLISSVTTISNSFILYISSGI